MEVLTKNKFLFFKPKNKLLYFIHTPKCGGKYVETMFTPYIQESPTLTLKDASGHLTWMEYRDVFLKHNINIKNALTFSVVRNPWDWHVSWFHYIKNDAGGVKSGHSLENKLFQDFEFSDYIDWLTDTSSNKSKQGYIIKQVSDWVIDESGKIAVNKILKQESLQQDLENFVLENNLDIKINPTRVNSSKRNSDYRGYYNTRTENIIANRHVRDLELFKYIF